MNPLYSMDTYVSLVSKHMLVGTDPVKPFECKSRNDSDVSFPISVGRAFANELMLKSKRVSEERLPIHEGRVPIKELEASFRVCSKTSDDIVDGRVVVSLL